MLRVFLTTASAKLQTRLDPGVGTPKRKGVKRKGVKRTLIRVCERGMRHMSASI